MSAVQQRVLVLALVLLAAFDVALLVWNKRLIAENEILKRKVTPSLGQQYVLFEARMQGEDFSSVIERMRASSSYFRALDDGLAGNKLLYYFPNENCRRSLHMEMKLFDQLGDTDGQGDPGRVMVFDGFENMDFRSMAQQFGVASFSWLDEQSILRDYLGVRGDPVIFLLDARDRVLLAKVSRVSDEGGSRAFYERMALFTES